MESSKYLVLIGICLILVVHGIMGAPADKKAKRKLREKKVKEITLDFVWKKVRILDAKLKRATADLEATKSQISKMGSGDSGGGAARFSDDPPCKKVKGFFQNEQFHSCYRLESSDLMVNWTEAVNLCKSYHPKAHLVSIETEEEFNMLKGRWLTERGIASVSRFWTSGYRTGQNWRWIGSDKQYTFTHWIPTSDHNDDAYRCMAVYSNEAYFWGDVACWAPHLVTCEVNL